MADPSTADVQAELKEYLNSKNINRCVQAGVGQQVRMTVKHSSFVGPFVLILLGCMDTKKCSVD